MRSKLSSALNARSWWRYLQKNVLETSNRKLLDGAGNASSSMEWFVLVSSALTLTEPELREKGNLAAAE